MIQIGDTIISEDIFECNFLCDLKQCKGVCCVEGTGGAPVEPDEVAEIENLLPALWDKLSAKARKLIDKQGIAYVDNGGELAISIIKGKAECIFAHKDEDGCWRCLIEKAYNEGKTTFRKPISCHLYPLRVKKLSTCIGVNYNRWQICEPAVRLGNEQQVALYQFLKEPLTRKFGREWYEEVASFPLLFQKRGENLNHIEHKK